MGSQELDSPLRFSSLVAPAEELAANWRNATQSYTLLAACEARQFAYEHAVDGKERYGVFTYWLIDTLKEAGTHITHKHLIDRVTAKVHDKFSQQTPVLIGEGDRLFFGADQAETKHIIAVLKVDEAQGQVILSDGMVHGIKQGTRFAIYPVNIVDFTDKHNQIAIVEITEVGASSSKAKILSPDQGGIELKQTIEPGAPAVLIPASLDLIRRVCLLEREAGDEQDQLPPELIEKQKLALDAVRQSLAGNGWLVEVENKQESDYQVVINRQGEYEICSGTPIENLNPSLLVDDPDAPNRIVKRLVHITKYHTVLALDNPTSDLGDALVFELLDENKEPLLDQNNITLQQGELVHLRLKNVSPESLNVAVLDLEPTWEISQIPLQGIDAPFVQLAPDQAIETRLRFSAPESEGYSQAKEILKLFATRGPADFKWLKLPPLDEEKPPREARSINNPLSNLLEALGKDADISPQPIYFPADRAGSDADWATKQIQITLVNLETSPR